MKSGTPGLFHSWCDLVHRSGEQRYVLNPAPSVVIKHSTQATLSAPTITQLLQSL